MTKVYGTGVFDFRRHRVAEYPVTVGGSDQPVPERPPESKPGTNLPSSITLVEIQRDRLTKIADANWSKTATNKEKPPFSAELVKEIYDTELLVKEEGGKMRRTVPLQRVMILEVSQYLENYLWPNFDPETSSFEHVMSMILMINEKFRENVAAWICFYDRKDMFKEFLERVLCLKEGRSLSIAEKTNYLLFMINAFQSLEDDIVSKKVMRLASLHCWHSLSFGRFQMELSLNPDLIKKWKRIAKKAKEAKKRGESFDVSMMLEVKFLRNLIGEFLEVLDSKVFYYDDVNGGSGIHGFEQINEASILYCERFMEFLIDLLSQLPTRRYFKPLVADVAVVAKCHLSVLYRHEKGKLFAQLVDLLQYYEGFEIDDNLGRQMTDDEVLQAHYERFQAFQLLSFKKIPKLRELALANIGAIHKRVDLSKKLSVLSPEELRDLVCSKLKLVSKNDPWTERVDFLIEVMVSFFEKQQSQKEAINALPLYPNEQIMWDESLVPSINYSGEGCLALPKLNLQFLTLHDYLLRNFNLFRLESTYEIREDIQEAVPHLLAYINNEGEPAFRGWSRMAVPIKEFKITEVKQPNIGEVKPSSVTAEVTFSISSYRAQIRSEWNALKEHDVLFLLCIRPSFEPLSADEAANASVPQRLGLQFVRGCEIIEMRDEEGTLMNDFTGKIKRDEWKPPKGELRTVTVALDTAQYHMDVSDIAEKGAEDVYGTFNILMRRKPKENNFKAILESIRDLMNETCIVPDWLHDIFLGYGNPSAAQWTNMPDLLETVDFKDTFLDADHVRECFSAYQVMFTNSDGTENLNPGPPFRINVPRNLKGNAHALPGNDKSTTASIDVATDIAEVEKEKLIVEAYMPPDPGPYPQDQPKQNSVRFTPTQVGAIISGIQPGLTMVVGPPGTGKTDTAVQILNVLYHNCPSQRTLIITHSNQALNDLFEKIMERDVPARYLLRLGQGEQELATDLDFSRQGRVNAMLVRRLELLSEVERLARSLQLPEDVGYTCETAGYFWLLHVYSRWEQFLAVCAENQDKPAFVRDKFPFTEFFSNTPPNTHSSNLNTRSKLKKPSTSSTQMREMIWLFVVVMMGVASMGGVEGRKVKALEGSLEYTAINCRSHTASIADFGGVGDGKTLNTRAFQEAVNKLSQYGSDGGAQLYVPAGQWLTGSFNLTSHFTLFLHKDATLLASQDINQWPVIDPLPSYGHGRDAAGGRYISLLFGTNLTDVIITGDNGTIDGQGLLWWQKFHGKKLKYTRPYLFEIMYSDTIQISNITFLNSPSWNVHPVYSSNILLQGITILAPIQSPNTDGINPDSCSNTRIEDTYIVSGDDCVAVKSGWDEYGISYGMPTEHLIIRRLTCISPYSAAIALGSEMSGGIRDVRAEDIVAINTESAVRIKTGVGRGGYVKDIYVKGMTLHTMKWVFWITGNYGSHADTHWDPKAVPVIQNINYQNVVAENVTMAARLEGISGDSFTGICISNATIGMRAKIKKVPWTCSDIEGVTSGVVPKPCDLLPDQGIEKIGMCTFPQEKLEIDNIELKKCSYVMA